MTQPPPASAPVPATEPEIVIRVRDVVVGFGEKLVLKGLDLDVRRGEVLGFVGGSGTGKSVLTRAILGLTPKRKGVIEVFGLDIDLLPVFERKALERRWGVWFPRGGTGAMQKPAR